MMSDFCNYILKNGMLVDPFCNREEKADIGVQDGLVVAPEAVTDPVVIDLDGKVVCPGFIDMHVHLRQPGFTGKETIKSGSYAAAAGGFTAIVAMPNTSPTADTPGTIEYIRRHTEQEAAVKIYPCGCMTKEMNGRDMAGIGGLKSAGVVAISDDGKCIQDHNVMRHLVEYAKTFSLPILDHCENENLVGDGVMHEGKWSTLLGLNAIPSASEELMVVRDIILSRMADWKIHIQHVSARESVEQIRTAHGKNIRVTAEVTPHHLLLTDEEIKHFDTNYKMNPPLRSEEDRLALIEGLKDNTITVIASDHAPHTETEKMVEFDYAPFGIIGLETSVSLCLTELYHKGVLSLPDFVAKFTKGPGEVLGLTEQSLAEGNPADITILDLQAEHRIDKNSFYSKSRNTPFHGRSVKGRAAATFVRGKPVFSLLPDLQGMINS